MLKNKKSRDILGGILVVAVLFLSHVMLTAVEWGYKSVATFSGIAMVLGGLFLIYVLNYKPQSREEAEREFRVSRGCQNPDDKNCNCPVCLFQNHEDL